MAEPLIDLNQENTLVATGLQGVKLNLGHSRMRAKYWRNIDGEWVQTGDLPADPMSISHYFSKGFKGKPPVVEGSVSESSPKTVRKQQSLGEGQFSEKTEIKLIQEGK